MTLAERFEFITLNIAVLLSRLKFIRILSENKRPVILCFHSVGNDNWRFSVSKKMFEAQIKYLVENKKVVSLDEILFHSKNVKNQVALTFDDGYQNWYNNVLPICKKFGVTGTIFLLGTPELANRDELKNELSLLRRGEILAFVKSGWEIGSHTMTHSDLRSLTVEELNVEIVDSKKRLEKDLKVKIKYLAYPRGFYSKAVLDEVEKAHYKAAFTIDGGYALLEKKYLINRISLEGKLSLNQFKILTSDFGIYFYRYFMKAVKCKESIVFKLSERKKFFIKQMLNFHKISLKYKIANVLKMFFMSPVFTVLDAILALWLRFSFVVGDRNNKGAMLHPKLKESKIVRQPRFNETGKKKNLPRRLRSVFFVFVVSIALLIILVGVIKGIPGSPSKDTLNESYWKEYGPIELSPDRGRFALTYSIAEDKSVIFSLPVARFATPDLGYKDGNYVSLFAPGVSFIILPGYLIGRIFDLSQFGSFLIIAFFAFINFWLIYLISKSLGSKKYSSLIAAGIFSLATPALAYGGSLYQHHISTFFILCSIWILFRFKSAWSLIPIWLMIGSSVVVDNPNFFMMFPIGVFALGRVVSFERISSRVSVKIKPFVIFTVLIVILPLAAFMYFNKLSYGSPFQLSGTVKSVQEIDINGQPAKSSLISESNVDVSLDLQASEEKHSKSAVGFFESRNMLNGFYTQFFSQDRGILFFSPIILLGLLGIIISYKKLNSIQVLLLSVLAANLAIYAMWGDPWGGWAFGSRYLIPAYAILAIFLSSVLTNWNRKFLFILLMYPVLIYSVGVNMVGALTSNRNPPKIDILALEKLSGVEQKYTVERNWDYLQKDSKAFVYRAFLSGRVSPIFYFYTLAGLSVAMFTFLIVANYFDKTKEEK